MFDYELANPFLNKSPAHTALKKDKISHTLFKNQYSYSPMSKSEKLVVLMHEVDHMKRKNKAYDQGKDSYFGDSEFGKAREEFEATRTELNNLRTLKTKGGVFVNQQYSLGKLIEHANTANKNAKPEDKNLVKEMEETVASETRKTREFYDGNLP
ncbi:hypothetical protein [Pseudoalteromonas luteoviolacea]|uniref:Uncharacterized protein n=1 Tax=Pseudoalteromonas luteoviolacea (strain 2ta16) TaxID=1353533 RepID=V4JEH5_PSEL2|nr:hypothetical protein [Pseudoalteromonas luteoviolacea]ESP93427.1 hypothetical protein PL2TA16_03280 [Pseudoalteromonas luteoviolacea 2ta16]KZN43901.1 hypothetical protein N483_08250 [Pseudoalteromonas luteoviolacea NCIMB 1944]